MASTEFTKKLRAAIKTKIQELGIEVDDELPDYIMVMIANKKDKTKMKNDLMLFLSDNTDPFVDWLFDFFDKVNKKETEDTKSKDSEKPVKREKKYETEDRERRTRSRSPRRSRSRSPRRPKREEEKPRREPIRAPSPSRRNRRRSRSVEDDRPRRREERKKITYSDSDDDNRKVKSAAVVPNKSDRNVSPPRVSSQVVVKKRKADPEVEKAATNIFKRAVTDLKDDEVPRRKTRRVEPVDDVLQVNTSKSTKRTILVEDDGSDEVSDDQPETQFIVKMNKATALRKQTLKAIRAMKEAENQLGDENVVSAKRKKRADDPSQSGSLWDGKISVEDEDSSESDNEEAEIDAFLADSLVPPTVSLSRPILPAPQRKVEVGKIPERCKFYPNCRNEAACLYSHPTKPCINFPNCWFGDKCLFIHPKCRFEPNCSKPGCPYMHTMPRVVQQPPVKPKLPNILPITNPQDGENNETPGSDSALKESTNIEDGKQADSTVENGKEEAKAEEAVTTENGQAHENEEDKKENTEEKEQPEEPKPDVPLQSGPLTSATIVPKIKPIITSSTVQCRFGNRCHNESCSFRHPKKCRYDEACTNESCFFWHPKKNAGRFRWTKT
uniref:Zinc finger CCCH domain-containing protein 14 n=1 Tax=Panagrolaimus sp. JU765 TaxID=591449 RepID=A0AC34Q170_9BILA